MPLVWVEARNKIRQLYVCFKMRWSLISSSFQVIWSLFFLIFLSDLVISYDFLLFAVRMSENSAASLLFFFYFPVKLTFHVGSHSIIGDN